MSAGFACCMWQSDWAVMHPLVCITNLSHIAIFACLLSGLINREPCIAAFCCPLTCLDSTYHQTNSGLPPCLPLLLQAEAAPEVLGAAKRRLQETQAEYDHKQTLLLDARREERHLRKRAVHGKKDARLGAYMLVDWCMPSQTSLSGCLSTPSSLAFAVGYILVLHVHICCKAIATQSTIYDMTCRASICTPET